MPVLTAARGLWTENNELARQDGALSVADNVNIDYDGVIQQRRGFNDYSSPEFSDSVRQLFTYKNSLLVNYGTKIAADLLSSGAFSDFNGTYLPLINGLRLKGLQANGNFYFTSSTGIKKISALNAEDIPTTNITDAGGVKANDLSGNVILDSSGFLPAQSKVAYRLVFGTKDSNTNLILGAPSARAVISNQSQDVNVREVFAVNFLTATIVSGNYWTFDTPTGGYYVWYDLTGTATPPVGAGTLDRTEVHVNMQPAGALTTTNLASYTANALSQLSEIAIELTGSEVQITVSNPGDVTDVAQGNILAANMVVTKILDGSTTTGSPALVELTFSIPERITTDYFYQIYRTAVVSVGLGQTLNDIDPGDEQYFVYESPILSADISAGEITVQDNTPEAFRQSGAPLYTNALTGDGTRGILEANNVPPIAHDIALFRNSTFYANTKEFHRYNLTMLSVDNFVSGTTKLSIGQGSSFTEYTFVGVPQVADITVFAASGTTNGSYIELNSAEDERQYYIWIDKGGATDPSIPNKLGIRVPLITPTLYPDTVAGSKQALLDSLALISDFSAVDGGGSIVTLTWTDSGASITPTDSAEWTISVTTVGDGEDVVAKEVLLSQSASIGIAIDKTARSLVKVINRDVDCPVTAQYLSSNEDLPGKILLEAKTLEDSQFYVAISDSSLSAEFNPELPSTVQVVSILTAGNLFTTSAPHGFAVGTKIYVNDNPGLVPVQFSGKYEVITVPSSTTFTLKNITVTINQPAIFGTTFKASAASDNNVNPNRIAFSKISQPEAVPLPNYIDVGSKDKAIMRILALRDNLFVLKEDGIYIVTGASAPDFSVRLLDNSAICLAPDSAVVLNNLIYALTTQGVVSISESGVSIVSRPIEDQIKKVTTFNYNFKYTSFGVSYESDRSYLLWLPEKTSDTVATQCYRYNTITNTWTRWTKSNTAGIVKLGDDRLYLGTNSSRNFIEQERKNGERQDYADRNFTRAIGADAISDVSLELSSTVGVAAGDVIVQEQYVSIPKYNRLLTKLDRDTGPADNDYSSALKIVTPGADMANALTNLVAKLNTDANLFGAFTTPSGSNTIAGLKDDYNLMINELNSLTSGTSLKDYKRVTDLVTYEVLITEVPKTSNVVTINFSTWFIQGNVEIFKAIVSEVEWAPQHFGKPQLLKQVSEGTLIFDQGTIYSGTIAYASDRSADFAAYKFTMSGPGFWASYPWANTVWGGGSNSIPLRTLVPQNKSRCRFLAVKFKHSNAREQYKLLGISLEPREIGPRGYR